MRRFDPEKEEAQKRAQGDDQPRRPIDFRAPERASAAIRSRTWENLLARSSAPLLVRAAMRILVTGGCGFIGSNFIRYILQHYKPASVSNVDVLTYAGNLANLGWRRGANMAIVTNFSRPILQMPTRWMRS